PYTTLFRSQRQPGRRCLLILRSKARLVWRRSGLLERDCVIVRLIDQVKELLERGIAGCRKDNATAAAKEKIPIIDQRASVRSNRHLSPLFADVLRHLPGDGRRYVRIIQSESRRKLYCHVVLFGPRVVKVDGVLSLAGAEQWAHTALKESGLQK